MTATFNWTIDQMQTKPSEDGLTDVVASASWRCTGAQVVNGTNYTSTTYGQCVFASPTGAFTPYDQLTQQQVLGWCWASGVDQSAIETYVQGLLDQQINPPIVVLPLPWDAPSA
jgi:hypothetical protein